MNKLGKHEVINTEKEIIIKLDIDQLIFALENNPDFECKITNKENFVQYVKDNLFELSDAPYDDEPKLFRLFDRMVEIAYENAEEFVKEVTWDDEN